MNKQQIELKEQEENIRYWWRQKGEIVCKQPQPMPGDNCPHCQQGKLMLDGLLMLICNQCGEIADSGCFT